jgi:uncharacterized protein YjbI with pentapeptide repeats
MKKYTQEELDQALAGGIKSFEECDLSGLDFSGKDLGRCLFLKYPNLKNTNFKKSNLKNVSFHNANLEHSDFQGAEFGKDTRFYGCCLKYANFYSTNLENVLFYECDLLGANFQIADLAGITIEKSNLTSSNFRGADLRGASLIKSYFGINHADPFNMDNSEIKKADFRKANLQGARDLDKIDIWWHADLDGAILTNDWVLKRNNGDFNE